MRSSSALLLLSLLFCLVLLSGAAASRKHDSPFFDESSSPLGDDVNPPEQWFSQKLDHSQPLSTVTWQQRFYVMNHWFNPAKSPLIILYICGESECKNRIYNSSFASAIAENFNGIIFSLEHRFYGIQSSSKSPLTLPACSKENRNLSATLLTHTLWKT